MSMEDEFPEMEYKNYQDEFLSDWWTRKKLFKGMRQSGKTELILSELNRFLKKGFDCLVLAPTQRMANDIKERYQKRFGEIPNCDIHSFKFHDIRGYNYEVVLLDELHRIEFDYIQNQIGPMNPMFIRACGSSSVDEEVISFFDSVYTV